MYASLMSQDGDNRVGDIIAAWKKNESFNESDLRYGYGRVVTITADEIVTFPSLAECSISPASGQSRLRVCARRVPAGLHVFDALPRMFPIDVNDGHVDVKCTDAWASLARCCSYTVTTVDRRRWPRLRQMLVLLSTTLMLMAVRLKKRTTMEEQVDAP